MSIGVFTVFPVQTVALINWYPFKTFQPLRYTTFRTMFLISLANFTSSCSFFCLGVLDSLAYANSELINYETVNLNRILAELLGAVMSQMQHYQFHRKIEAQKTDFPASNGIRTHDPSVRAGEIISCFFRRPHDHCNRCVACCCEFIYYQNNYNYLAALFSKILVFFSDLNYQKSRSIYFSFVVLNFHKDKLYQSSTVSCPLRIINSVRSSLRFLIFSRPRHMSPEYDSFCDRCVQMRETTEPSYIHT
jgi:hypothetical protein